MQRFLKKILSRNPASAGGVLGIPEYLWISFADTSQDVVHALRECTPVVFRVVAKCFLDPCGRCNALDTFEVVQRGDTVHQRDDWGFILFAQNCFLVSFLEQIGELRVHKWRNLFDMQFAHHNHDQCDNTYTNA